MHTLPGQILIGVALLAVVAVASELIALNPRLSPATVHRAWQDRRTAHRAMATFEDEWQYHNDWRRSS